jgi:hypothetical protein
MLPQFTVISAGETGQKKPYRVNKIDDEAYEVQPEGEAPTFQIVRQPASSWIQTNGDPVPAAIVDEIGENLNSIDQEEFEFPLVYEGEAVLCRVAMGESGFGVLFDNTLVAEINVKDDGVNWEVTSGGPLNDDVVYEIGKEIDRHYA